MHQNVCGMNNRIANVVLNRSMVRVPKRLKRGVMKKVMRRWNAFVTRHRKEKGCYAIMPFSSLR